jgi:hypothetical protein
MEMIRKGRVMGWAYCLTLYESMAQRWASCDGGMSCSYEQLSVPVIQPTTDISYMITTHTFIAI